MEDFGPAVHAVGIGEAELNIEIRVLLCNSEPIALAGEDVGTGDEALEDGRILSLAGPGQEDTMPSQHGFDGFGVALNDPVSGGMLVHDDDVAMRVGGVMARFGTIWHFFVRHPPGERDGLRATSSLVRRPSAGVCS